MYEKIASAGLGLDFGILIVLAIYLSGILGKVKAEKALKEKRGKYTSVCQMAMGIISCLLGIVFVLTHINDTAGYIWLGCGAVILIFTLVRR